MQRIKRFINKIQVIGIIGATIIAILVPFLKDNKFVCLGWGFLALHLFGDAIFLKKWRVDGITWFRRNDKNYKKNLTRKYSDISFLTVFIVGMLMCIIGMFEKTFSKNYVAYLISYIVVFALWIFLIYITDRTSRQIKELIPKKK